VDKHGCGSSWGEAWTVLTNMAVSLTNLLHREERTIREVREKWATIHYQLQGHSDEKKRGDGLRSNEGFSSGMFSFAKIYVKMGWLV